MSKLNPFSQAPSLKVAQRIDHILRNEKSEAYFTLKPLNEVEEKKFNQITDQMYGYLSQQWLQTAGIKSYEDRLVKVRSKANKVLHLTENPAASSMGNRAIEKSLDILLHRDRNGIPLHEPMVAKYAPAAALSAPATDAGNALTRSASYEGSAISAGEPVGPPPGHPARPGYTLA